MGDAGDQVVSDDERAMALFEADQQRRRIAESRNPYVFNPTRKCCECGNQIPLARLKALPTVGNCADCARALEEKNRSRT